MTTDPHSYNTIRNEYPDFGDVAPIRHYTSVLAELLESGRLNVVKPLGKRVTLHDPCHLGRLNGHYDEPRRVLELIGCELIDMPRCRDKLLLLRRRRRAHLDARSRRQGAPRREPDARSGLSR